MVICLAVSASSEELHKGVHVKKVKDGTSLISLDKGAAIMISQSDKNGRMFIASNDNGTLQVLQLEDGGHTPVHVKFTERDKAEISITRGKHSLPMLIDKDGDGIPDSKFEAGPNGKIIEYKLKSIKWEAVDKK